MISIKENDTTRKLYTTVANKYSTTASRVERGIHHAIDVAWRNADEETLNTYFSLKKQTARIKPINLEFISGISEKLSLNIKE